MYLTFQPRQHVNVESFLNTHVPRQLPSYETLTIDLSHARLNEQDITRLFQLICNSPVRELNLSRNHLSERSLIVVAQWASSNRTVEKIRLSRSQIDDQGAQLLAGAMRINHKVNFDLSHNNIGKTGALSYVQSCVATSKRSVDLSNNQIGDDGASEIARNLRQNAGQITRLVLKNNGITSQGDITLYNTLPRHITVVHRVEVVPFVEAHPYYSLFMIILFFPSLFLLAFMKGEKEIEGCAAAYFDNRNVRSLPTGL